MFKGAAPAGRQLDQHRGAGRVGSRSRLENSKISVCALEKRFVGLHPVRAAESVPGRPHVSATGPSSRWGDVVEW